MPDKEFKIIILRKPNEIKKTMDRQFNEIWKTIYDVSGKFSEEIEITKKNQSEKK